MASPANVPLTEPGALLRIEAPHFTAGLILGQEAAPIIRYMKTWGIEQITAYCRKKRWVVRLLDETTRTARKLS